MNDRSEELNSERDSFERWASRMSGLTTIKCHVTGLYYNERTEAAWDAWQARSEQAVAESMAKALEHAAYVCVSYAREHSNPDRAFGARAVGGVILSKADALRHGSIQPELIINGRGTRSPGAVASQSVNEE